MGFDGFAGFVDRLARDQHFAISRSQVDGPAGIDRILPADRLIDQRIGHQDLQHVERFDVIRRLGDQFHGIDQQDVGGLDDVSRQRAFIFFGRHAGHPRGDARLCLRMGGDRIRLSAHGQRGLAAGGQQGDQAEAAEPEGPTGKLSDECGKPVRHDKPVPGQGKQEREGESGPLGGLPAPQRALIGKIGARPRGGRRQSLCNRHCRTNRQSLPRYFELFACSARHDRKNRDGKSLPSLCVLSRLSSRRRPTWTNVRADCRKSFCSAGLPFWSVDTTMVQVG